MSYDYEILKRAAVALRGVLIDCEEVHRERADFSRLLEGFDAYNGAGELMPGRKAPNPLREPMPNPVYKNEAGIKIMTARRNEALQAMSPANRSAIVAMCQARADRSQEPTPEMLELHENLQRVIAEIRADSWNKSWSYECGMSGGIATVIDLEQTCRELADSMAVRFPDFKPKTSPIKGKADNVPAPGNEPRKRGGNTAKKIGSITIDQEKLKPYFSPKFCGLNDAKLDTFSTFCRILERDAVNYRLKDLAKVAYCVGCSEYFNKTITLNSFPRWLALFFSFCGCTPPSDKTITRYRYNKNADAENSTIIAVVDYLGKLTEPAKWKAKK